MGSIKAGTFVPAFFTLFKKKLTINNFNIICKKTYNYYKKLENYNIKSKQKVIKKISEK